MADLLFITPILPCPTGHGAAMRASIAVELLAARHRVFVVNTGQWGRLGVDDAWVLRHAAGCVPVPPQPDAPLLARLVNEQFPGARFEKLYVFRMAAASIALQVQAMLGSPRPATVFDLDDNEVERAQRFIPLREEAGDHQLATMERTAMARLQVFLKVFLPRFDKILLAAERDRQALAGSFPGKQFVYLPNVVRPAARVPLPRDPRRIMFVGTLDYLPNEDGIVHFCNAVLPLLREAGAGCNLRVIGSGAPRRVQDLAGLPDVQLTGFVRDLAPEYAQAGLLIVPLRAGSGTRIKILEAISHGCPVVSTPIGAEGLNLEHERHCLLAETPEEFAAACLRMITDEALRTRLAANASAWMRDTHSMERARAVLLDVLP